MLIYLTTQVPLQIFIKNWLFTTWQRSCGKVMLLMFVCSWEVAMMSFPVWFHVKGGGSAYEESAFMGSAYEGSRGCLHVKGGYSCEGESVSRDGDVWILRGGHTPSPILVSYPKIVHLSALIPCNVMNWPGGDALFFSHRFHHWLMLYPLGQYIVNVQSSTTSDGFSTIFIFRICWWQLPSNQYASYCECILVFETIQTEEDSSSGGSRISQREV